MLTEKRPGGSSLGSAAQPALVLDSIPIINGNQSMTFRSRMTICETPL